MTSSYSFSDFLAAHKSQLEAGGVPPEQWGSLHRKLSKEEFDAGDSFRLVCEEGDDGKNKWSALALKDMDPVDEDCVFLIDHAWTFRPHKAREELEQLPDLVNRLKNIMDIDENAETDDEGSDDEVTTEDAEKQKVDGKAKEAGDVPRHESVDARLCFSVKEENDTIDRILKKMWQYVNTYTVRFKTTVDEDGMPLWYVMDEFGSRIAHSDNANVRVVPLFFVPHGIAYNVMFLVKEVKEDEEVTRDYVDTALCKEHPDWRPFLMTPWRELDSANKSGTERPPLNDSFFLSGRATIDKLPSKEMQVISRSTKKNGTKLRIYADDTQLVQHLKNVEYELVDDWKKADVLWLIHHYHQFDELCADNPTALVNQFPYESCLTVKDLLSAILMQLNNGVGPKWFQTSFNLNCELPQFVSYYNKLAKSGGENTWIVKPWNLARGLDMHVSNDLGHIVRLIECGPKIACKYISRPVLFPRPDNGNRVKFDMRFILFVNSLQPVEAYVYNNFWIRFAINEFSLSQLDDIETHFTVFNYGDKEKILQMQCQDFIRHLEGSYSSIQWKNVQVQINTVLKQALEEASRNESPLGVAPNVQSRAMYGADIMLQWIGDDNGEVQATLLECNFMPDCERACNYYPDFADTVFRTMFLNEIDPSLVTPL